MITQEFLDELISCRKKAINADRKKMLLKNRSYKNKIRLISYDEQYQFILFLRQSSEFIEDFSVGLIWENPNQFITVKKPILLIRFQGPHDGKKPMGSDIHHDFHMHQISLDDITHKRYQKPSNRNVTDKFEDFSSALSFCLQKCDIIGLENIVNLEELLGYRGEQTCLF